MGSGDDLFYCASIDGGNFFYGNYVVDSSTNREPPTSDGWRAVVFDLTNVYNLGDVTGQPTVYFGWFFQSDATGTDDGPFLDDVLIEKRIGSRTATPTATSTRTRTSTATLTRPVTQTATPQTATLNGTVSLQGLTPGMAAY